MKIYSKTMAIPFKVICLFQRRKKMQEYDTNVSNMGNGNFIQL